MLYDMTMNMTMNMTSVASWSVTDVFMMFIMWAIMMAGMMLPSAIPVILLVNKLNLQRISSNQSYTPTIVFTFGYITTWCLYSLVITFLQYFLHHLGLLTPMMDSANITFSASIYLLTVSWE
jgi:predicted metal-binding membrane protein